MTNKSNFLKWLDIAAAVLLVIGGLNWGLVGLFGFNLVSAIFGEMSALSRIIYILVGLSALYDAVMFRSIQRRWECRQWPAPSKGST
jgi:uncharacterized membrane protein YuzA (DUF378 family)